jgi:serine/threonine protein kinase/WD40 repeat protein/tetratricopeptide (TPR) repeat protein
MPSSDSSRHTLERLAEEFVERYRRGERPALSEYADRHPDLAAEIRDLFPALVQIEHLKPAPGDQTGAFSPTGGLEAGHTPERLGEYRILRQVGHGGMGVVYEAEQESLGRHVALKVLPRQALFKGTFLDRFRREAKAAGKLHHTNIVPVFGVGECDGTHYYVMQFIRGEGLDKVLEDLRRLRAAPGAATAAATISAASVSHSLLSGQLAAPGAPPAEQPPARPAPQLSAASDGTHSSTTLSAGGPEANYFRGVARVAVQVADALAYAHRQGIVHRDIKPSNLLLDQQGTVWITDFGLAKAEGADDLTQTGDIVGTVRYMAPERFDGRSLPQSDVYALGVTLYEMLTLQPAFEDVNKARLVKKVLHEPATPPRKIDPRIPRDLETVVLKCLAKDPAERYANAEALAEDVRRFLADRPIKARRASWREQTWRWCRRNPVVASLSAALLLLLTVTAVGGVVMSLRLNDALGQAETDRDKAQEAELRGKRRLFQSYVSEADAKRMSRQPGQRFDTLRRVRDALEIGRDIGMSAEDRLRLRNIAIAALCLPDMEPGLKWPAGPDKPLPRDLDPVIRRQVLAGYALARLPARCSVLKGDSWFSPDGRFVAVGLPQYAKRVDFPAQVWRVDGPKPRLVFEEPNGPYEDATAFSPDSRQVAFGHIFGGISIYDPETGKRIRRLPPGPGPTFCLAFHPRLPRLAAANGSEVTVWDLTSGQRLLRVGVPGGAYSIAWHPRGHRFATGSGNGLIYLWDAQTGQQPTAPWRGSQNGGIKLAFTHSGDRVVSNGWEGVLRLWDAATGQLLLSRPGSFGLGVASDDRAVGHYGEGTNYRVLRLAGGQELRTLHHPQASGPQGLDRLALHPNGRLLAATTGGGIGFFDLPSCEEVAFLATDLSPVGGVGFDGTGALWTSSSAGLLRWPVRRSAGSARKWRIGPPEWVTNQAPDGVAWGSFSTDGRVAVVPLYSEGALVVHRGPPRRPLRVGPQFDVRAAFVSPDGRWVATQSHWIDGSGVKVKIWEAETGKLLANFPYPEVSAFSGFTPDSRGFYVSGQVSRRVDLASIRSAPLKPTEAAAAPPAWQQRWATGPAPLGGVFHPDQRLRAIGSDAGVIRLMKADKDEGVARLPAPEVGRFSPSSFSRDGTLLLARGGESHATYIYDLSRIRAQLADLGLDWGDVQPLPPARAKEAGPKGAAPLLQVELAGAEWAATREKMNQYETARAVIALSFNPLDAGAHYRLGALQLDAGKFQEAKAHFTAALAFRSDLHEAYRLRASAAVRLQRWDDAVADLTRFLDHYPHATNPRVLRANIHQAHRRYREALGDWGTLIQSHPELTWLYERRAACYEGLGQPGRAKAEREKAVKVGANNPVQLNNLAWSLANGPVRQRDLPRATDLIRKAREMDPDNSTFLNTLGVIQYRNGQTAQAIVTLEKSLAAGKGQSDGFDLFFLAMCHAKFGDPAKAKDCFDRAVKWTEGQKKLGRLQQGWAEELKAFRAEAEVALRPR